MLYIYIYDISSLRVKFNCYTTIRCVLKQVHIHDIPDLTKRPWIRWRSLVNFFKSDDFVLFQTWLACQDVTQLRVLFHCSGTVPWAVIKLCNILHFRLTRFADLLFQYLFYSPDSVLDGQRQLPFRVLSWFESPVHQTILIERSSSYKAHRNNLHIYTCTVQKWNFLYFGYIFWLAGSVTVNP